MFSTLEQPAIASWRDALTRLEHDATCRGWLTLRRAALRTGFEPALWDHLYPGIIIQRGLFQTLLLAALQEPAGAHDATFDEIAQRARALRFDHGQVDRRFMLAADRRRFNIAAAAARSRHATAVALYTRLMRAYVAPEADGPQAAPDLADSAMASARDAAAQGDPDRMLAQIAHAGALALRGDTLWDGWLREGDDGFHSAVTMLITQLDWAYLTGFTPLGAPDQERRRVQRYADAISDRYSIVTHDPHRTPTPPEFGPSDLYEWVPPAAVLDVMHTILQNGGLSDAERAAMPRARLRGLGDGVLSMIQTRANIESFGPPPQDDMDDDERTLMLQALERDGLLVIGHLRYVSADGLNTLLGRATDPELDGSVSDAAVWALQQLGNAALEPARKTARFASDPFARQQAERVLAGHERGRPFGASFEVSPHELVTFDVDGTPRDGQTGSELELIDGTWRRVAAHAPPT